MIYQGQRVFQAPHLTEQFRFPKSKGKRIRKKWAGRPENHRPSPKAYITPAGIFLHPMYYRKLQQAIAGAPAQKEGGAHG